MTATQREEHRIYIRNYRAKNPEKFRIISKEQGRKWRRDNPEKSRALYRYHSRKWQQANPEKFKAAQVKTKLKNPHIVLSNRIRDRINRVLKGARKSDSTFALVGCSPIELKFWLENQFQLGMTWKNRSAWHIDHKKPCASFDLSDPVQQKVCFHYTNLQPLWAADNLAKGSRVTL